ncbi:MAG: hypothetical protein KAU28_03230 [Phycisphaerae bacterium]|nr:hypothetical protein [Phycisphaerae bacterium]
MSETVEQLLTIVCDMIAARFDADRLAAARRRHADMMAGRESDYIPMVFLKPVAETAELPHFNWAEQFYDPAKSLYVQLKEAILPLAAADADNVPWVRADTGVVNCMSVFGAEFAVPEHSKPVVTAFPSKQALAEFAPPADISTLGTMPIVKEHMEYHLEVLRRHDLEKLVNVTHCDQQGPFDIAAQSRGHDVFTDLYDDPDFLHDLMGKCTEIYLAVTKFCKAISGGSPDGYNVYGRWIETGGARMCGDSDILISAEKHREFVQPYEQRAFEAIGGGWFHYCGGVKGYNRAEGLHLHEAYAEIEGLRGLNWTTAGDWIAELRKLKDWGIVHVGTFDRQEGEDLEDYMRRFLSVYDSRKGAIFEPILRPGEHEKAMTTWHKLQDELFS